MTTARKDILLADQPGVYHCISRCVRRAFLCGYDPYAQRHYEHRREWVRHRIQTLVELFSVEVLAYAVMANHLHIVLRSDPLRPAQWSDEDVARRWCRLFPKGWDDAGNPIPPTKAYLNALLGNQDRLALCRERLGNLSWFMRCLDENIARRANAEDKCTGRFWEGRFKCQRLADEGAILACMAYVDLNPVRARIADRPELSEFTSICDRVTARQGREQLAQIEELPADPTPAQSALLEDATKRSARDHWLCPIEQIFSEPASCEQSGDRESRPPALTLDRYLELVDWTGRRIRGDDEGCIPNELSAILDRLALDTTHWVESVERYGGLFHRVSGQYRRILEAARRAGQQWMHGLTASRFVYRGKPADVA